VENLKAARANERIHVRREMQAGARPKLGARPQAPA
jgi:hypothetical protein